MLACFPVEMLPAHHAGATLDRRTLGPTPPLLFVLRPSRLHAHVPIRAICRDHIGHGDAVLDWTRHPPSVLSGRPRRGLFDQRRWQRSHHRQMTPHGCFTHAGILRQRDAILSKANTSGFHHRAPCKPWSRYHRSGAGRQGCWRARWTALWDWRWGGCASEL